MKRLLIFALVVILALSLAACGNAKDAVQNAVKDALPGSQNGGATQSDEGDISEEDWDKMQDWAHAQGWDGEGYRFPQVDSMREWPSSSIWAELGLPDMMPDKMENGEVYNDGNTHIDGYSDAFVAECESDDDSFHALAKMLWDAGIKGVNPGNGNIIPAEDMDWLIEDDPNYLWYRAYYEHKGDIMEVYLQKMNGWGDSLWVGVVFAPSDPNFEWMQKISWPASEIKAIAGVDLPNPGGTIYGNVVTDDDWPTVELIIEDVSQADYESYVQNLKDGKVPGVLLDDNGSSWDFHGTYGHAFYPEDYEKYPAYIDVNYASGILFITVYEI